MFVLYEALLILGLILALPYFLIAGILRGKYIANFPERLGFYRTPAARHDPTRQIRAQGTPRAAP